MIRCMVVVGALATTFAMPGFAAETADEMRMDPIPVHAEPPVYPREALLSGKEGWVRLAFVVQDDGSVRDVSVVDAEPGRLFNAAATRAIEKWRFDPADAGPAQYTIEFKIGGSDDVADAGR